MRELEERPDEDGTTHATAQNAQYEGMLAKADVDPVEHRQRTEQTEKVFAFSGWRVKRRASDPRMIFTGAT